LSRPRTLIVALTLALVTLPLAASAVPTRLAEGAPAKDPFACAENPLLAGAQIIPVVPTNHPVASPCGGIRPGSALTIKAGSFDFMYCTLAFIVTDGTDLYAATAGHCVDPSLGVPGPGQRVSALGVPGTFGTVAYQWCEDQAVNGGCGAGKDFALIRIDADKHSYVNRAMCHWGAPTGGLFTAKDQTLRTIQHFGWGMFLGEASGVMVTVGNPATQAREGLGLDFSEGYTYAFVHTPAISGDSGSGVLVGDFDVAVYGALANPQALGVLTHITVGGFAVVQRLDVSLAKAGVEMGKTFTLY